MTAKEVDRMIKWRDEVSEKLSADGWEEMWSPANHCQMFRKIENGRGKWLAAKDGEVFPITYEQALGYEPLTNGDKLARKLGEMLLPNSSRRG